MSPASRRGALPGGLAGLGKGHGPGSQLPGHDAFRLGSARGQDPGCLRRPRGQDHLPGPALARRLDENLRVRGVAASIVVEEGCAWMAQEGPAFDLILVDAPCSGSGTLRKHPELTWLGEDLDLERLVETQRALLRAAATRLAPGGLLIYSVCSWLRIEGLDHRAWILGEGLGLEPARVWPSDAGTGDSFHPDPLLWEGEGFQAFALTRG
jgi:16S rRNA (cytosine967-C5)-methyltransferase